jgi:hypothetical protein
LRNGHRVFSFTYHSPSLAPGNTPYVRSAADLRAFLQRIERYLDFLPGRSAARRRRHSRSRRLPNDGAWRGPRRPNTPRSPIARRGANRWRRSIEMALPNTQ